MNEELRVPNASEWIELHLTINIESYFERIESQEFSEKFVGIDALTDFLRKAWNDPHRILDQLFDATSDPKLLEQLVVRTHKLLGEPVSNVTALILYAYIVDIRSASAGRPLITAVFTKLYNHVPRAERELAVPKPGLAQQLYGRVFLHTMT